MGGTGTERRSLIAVAKAHNARTAVWKGRKLAKALGVRVTPAYVILDGEGVIRGVHEGQADPEVLRRAVGALRSEGLTGAGGS